MPRYLLCNFVQFVLEIVLANDLAILAAVSFIVLAGICFVGWPFATSLNNTGIFNVGRVSEILIGEVLNVDIFIECFPFVIFSGFGCSIASLIFLLFFLVDWLYNESGEFSIEGQISL